MIHLSMRGQRLKHYIVAPFVFILIIPIVLLDFFIEIYHQVAFPLYGIQKIMRSSYIKIDRHKLKYLNILQKIFCMYCGYANGAIHYWLVIAAQTEKYWCGIQHKKNPGFITPKHHEDFTEYENENEFREKYLK